MEILGIGTTNCKEAILKSSLDVVVKDLEIFVLIFGHIANKHGKLSKVEESNINLVMLQAVKYFTDQLIAHMLLILEQSEHG